LLQLLGDEIREIARARVAPNSMPSSPAATVSWSSWQHSLHADNEFARNNLVFRIRDEPYGASVAHPAVEQADNEKS
jgi:hypothetical protein